MSSRTFRYFLSLALVLPVFGLSGGLRSEATAGSGDQVARLDGVVGDGSSQAERIEELTAIGYLAGTEAPSESTGVTLYDQTRTASGLTLITSAHGPVGLLMSMDGTVVHEWRTDFWRVFPNCLSSA